MNLLKKIISVVLGICLLLSMTACGAASSDAYQHISQEKAKEMMDTQEVLILDVREQDEYDGGHIPGAVLLPVGAIDEESAAGVIPEKDTTLLVYCRSGSRSKRAAKALADLGYAPGAADGVYGFSMDGDDLYIPLLCGAV